MATQNNNYRLTELPKELTARGREVWLAGLGAVATVEEESSRIVVRVNEEGKNLLKRGTDFYNTLVQRGEKMEQRGKKQIEETTGEVMKRQEKASRKLEDVVNEAVEASLDRLGVLTRGEVKKLSTKIENLSRKVDVLATELEKKQAAARKEPAVYMVVAREEGWAVRREGAKQASSTHNTKVEAVEAARELSKNNAPSRLIIQRQDGTIQEELTYEQED